MTSGEVEFLGDPEPVPVPPAQRTFPAGLVALIGWLVASGLAVVAPFLPVYRRAMPQRYAEYLPGTVGAGPDGWDRVGGLYVGIPLVVCAGVFAVLLGLGVLRAVRLRRGLRAPGAALDRLAVAAPCLLAGVVAVFALYVTSIIGTDGASVGWFGYVPLNSTSAYSSSLQVSVSGGASPGWCLWLAVAALVCGAAGSAAHLTASPRERYLAG